ncbi:hypothetical protein A3F37_00750 [Candidatus Saccharibacteria bacterium RIFCSPHIGHO2_12_FULL_41_12]|nr:MAG: hypothetical protein A3F37_00750 [Candidatus Saccharibacteria bacterium RIFCSPHIGHO2_12_FULL_41_12]
MRDIAIRVKGVNKSFKLPHEQHNSIKSLFVSVFRPGRTFEKQDVLKNVSLDVKQGEFFGIVGRNGSGKSTLLKLIAGIYSPDTGGIQVNGKLTPFIELGVGFNPELTGRENVFMNGALLGFDRKEMNAMYNDIVSFAELDRFMDQKLKNYSSGMQVRLAFSIAIRAKTDILILDEVLAVGDLDFQKKCYSYFFNLKKSGQTVVLVTHDMSVVRKFCNRSALISGGVIEKIGDPEEVAELYEEINLRVAEGRLANGESVKQFKQREGTKEAEIIKVETFDAETKHSQNTFSAKEKIGVRLTYKANKLIEKPSLSFILQDQEDRTVFATNNWIKKQPTKNINSGDTVIFETIIDNALTDGEYTVTSAIESTDFSVIYDRIEQHHKFMVGGHKLSHALSHPHHEMTIHYLKGGR